MRTMSWDAGRDMSIDPGAIVSRSPIGLGIEPSLRGSLAHMANGRVLVIDYFASRRCSVVVGDLTADFVELPPGPGDVEVGSVEGVRAFVEPRLLAVLADTESSLRLSGPPFARHLAIDLDPPERWLDFLEEPGVLIGRRRFTWRRRQTWERAAPAAVPGTVYYDREVSTRPALQTHVDAGNPIWHVVWRATYVVTRRLGRLVQFLVALRVPSFDNEIVKLSLVGRKTGRPRPVLVTLLSVDGRWYVGHPDGQTAWLANLGAAESVALTLPRQPPVHVRSVPLGLGGERDAVIRATATQQPMPVRPLYRASRRHVLRAGIYHRLEIVLEREPGTSMPSAS